jgi:hypothetical protein
MNDIGLLLSNDPLRPEIADLLDSDVLLLEQKEFFSLWK